MRYFVLGPDGAPYGPADIDLLRQWVAEGRVAAETMLREEGSSREFRADQLPELRHLLVGRSVSRPRALTPICPHCGAAMPPGLRAGLCPSCGARPYGPAISYSSPPGTGLDGLFGFLASILLILGLPYAVVYVSASGRTSLIVLGCAVGLVLAGYFATRGSRPGFAKGLRLGLLAFLSCGVVVGALALGLITICSGMKFN
jgi:hypothetical protein